MLEPSRTVFNTSARSEWVRLRTLINLRWLAIVGQSVAVAVAHYGLGLDLALGLCVAAIGASVIFNLAATFMLPQNRRLSQRETTLTLLFDLGQLVFLLYLNGGLNNPFTLLILAPVTISATALRVNATLLVGGVAIAAISTLTFVYLPLRMISGDVVELPQLYLAGYWTALLIGILFLGGYARRVTSETFSMSQALAATQMALAREHELALLGGVVAAAAHEMGTPLATIKLVASELTEELEGFPELREDAELITAQTDRLREILRDMGRAGKDDLLLKTGPLTSIIQEAAEPHENRGKFIHFFANGTKSLPKLEEIPFARRNPEFIHGVRNLIQNAVDFASTTVWVQTVWTQNSIQVLVGDDGPGYPPELLGRIGDPFLSKRKFADSVSAEMADYEGMGLGLFIAKTMLERTGADLTFANASLDGYATGHADGIMEAMEGATGAIVNVRWNRSTLEVDRSGMVGRNQPISPTR
jgi:two-component system sensor histidine kinase RegB